MDVFYWINITQSIKCSRIGPFGLVSGTSNINSIKVILSELLVIKVLEHFELQLNKMF